MGILDALEGVSGQQSGSTNAKVAGGLMQALDEHPGGLAGVMDQFRQNGMGDHAQNWSSRQGQAATPAQVQQGLGGTDLLDNVAAKAGVSPEMAKMAMAVVLPRSCRTLRRADINRLHKAASMVWLLKSSANLPKNDKDVRSRCSLLVLISSQPFVMRMRCGLSALALHISL